MKSFHTYTNSISSALGTEIKIHRTFLGSCSSIAECCTQWIQDAWYSQQGQWVHLTCWGTEKSRSDWASLTFFFIRCIHLSLMLCFQYLPVQLIAKTSRCFACKSCFVFPTTIIVKASKWTMPVLLYYATHCPMRRRNFWVAVSIRGYIFLCFVLATQSAPTSIQPKKSSQQVSYFILICHIKSEKYYVNLGFTLSYCFTLEFANRTLVLAYQTVKALRLIE